MTAADCYPTLGSPPGQWRVPGLASLGEHLGLSGAAPPSLCVLGCDPAKDSWPRLLLIMQQAQQ